MRVADLTVALIKAASKGANIARIIRSENALLQLLVQEKTGDAKNERFVHDFKTLADVLVQEMVRHDLNTKFPGIKKNVFGEESDKFTNAHGECISISIQPLKVDTFNMLSKVLNGNENAAHLLTEAVYTDVDVSVSPELEQIKEKIDQDDIGIWIDPIDSTAQYIQGSAGVPNEFGVVCEGLQCVAVLIGTYEKQTGLPIIGVVNQPFWKQQESGEWSSQCLWGVSFNDLKVNSITELHSCSSSLRKKMTVVMSSSENETVQKALSKDFCLCYAAGAGYKCLCILDGSVDAYLLSKGSTFKWDTCGPHAILRSMGGGVVRYSDCLKWAHQLQNHHQTFAEFEVKYHTSDMQAASGIQTWNNTCGIIAFSDEKTLRKILSVF